MLKDLKAFIYSVRLKSRKYLENVPLGCICHLIDTQIEPFSCLLSTVFLGFVHHNSRTDTVKQLALSLPITKIHVIAL